MFRPVSLPPESPLFRDDGSVVTVTPPPALTDSVVAYVLANLEARLARKARYVLIFDLSNTGTPSAVQRQLLAVHMKKNRELILESIQAMGVVVASPIVRGVLTAIFWIEAPPVPHQIFGSLAEAAIWAREQVRSTRAP
jgi:hypothetical protein